MSELYLLLPNERKDYFDEAANRIGIPSWLIEKDYWVVWTLEILFTSKFKEDLIFKGGTSLSKVYHIIERFSEDIDVSINRNFLGKNPDNMESNNKKREAVTELKNLCSNFVQKDFLTSLKESIGIKLNGLDGWSLTVDAQDPDLQTLLFHYPKAIIADGNYNQQSVKIEMGARSDHYPKNQNTIQSYVKEVFPDKVTENPVIVQVLSAERTFWEKATILHQYAHLPDGKLVEKISRHYYDFYCLLKSEIKEKASKDYDLLGKVVTHKKIYFSSGWANYDAAKKGTLKLIPSESIQKALKEDYAKMKQMIFGKAPDFQTILEAIKEFEDEFNAN